MELFLIIGLFQISIEISRNCIILSSKIKSETLSNKVFKLNIGASYVLENENSADIFTIYNYKIVFPKIFETGFSPFLTSCLIIEVRNDRFLVS